MSWSFSKNGRPGEVKQALEAQRATQSKLHDPEERMRHNAFAIITVSMDTWPADKKVKVDSWGSQTVDGDNIVATIHLDIISV